MGHVVIGRTHRKWSLDYWFLSARGAFKHLLARCFSFLGHCKSWTNVNVVARSRSPNQCSCLFFSSVSVKKQLYANKFLYNLKSICKLVSIWWNFHQTPNSERWPLARKIAMKAATTFSPFPWCLIPKLVSPLIQENEAVPATTHLPLSFHNSIQTRSRPVIIPGLPFWWTFD